MPPPSKTYFLSLSHFNIISTIQWEHILYFPYYFRKIESHYIRRDGCAKWRTYQNYEKHTTHSKAGIPGQGEEEILYRHDLPYAYAVCLILRGYHLDRHRLNRNQRSAGVG